MLHIPLSERPRTFTHSVMEMVLNKCESSSWVVAVHGVCILYRAKDPIACKHIALSLYFDILTLSSSSISGPFPAFAGVAGGNAGVKGLALWFFSLSST